MIFPRRKHAQSAIAELDLSAVVAKAQQYFDLQTNEIEPALRDYRHFMYLSYWNRREGNRIQVVPTKGADKIWHAHLLFTRAYMGFCQNLTGDFIHHNPGLTEGSVPFLEAVAHTKLLHDRRGQEGFNPDYFGHVRVERSKGKGETSSSDGGDGMLAIHMASCGSSCSSCSSCCD